MNRKAIFGLCLIAKSILIGMLVFIIQITRSDRRDSGLPLERGGEVWDIFFPLLIVLSVSLFVIGALFLFLGYRNRKKGKKNQSNKGKVE
ncbi:MAG: hypothetical protein FWE45_04585 [Firmicutes bacterium]|nr:hypothetical protein [Bacillota bacterium]